MYKPDMNGGGLFYCDACHERLLGRGRYLVLYNESDERIGDYHASCYADILKEARQ